MISGTIKINNYEIAAWSAVRKERQPNHMVRYECHMDYRGDDGYPYTADYDVMHDPFDGALALTNLVTVGGMANLRRKPV